jgi:hypothetical protein
MIQPKPFCFNPKLIKAFVLGCDPTNFTDNGKPAQLDFVFGLIKDKLVSLMLKIRNKPVSVLSRYISYIFG